VHEKAKKENILDLTKYVNKQLIVKFNGGRESEWPWVTF
jgi:U6 snRNA-associated Sm-like protein LSm7